MSVSGSDAPRLGGGASTLGSGLGRVTSSSARSPEPDTEEVLVVSLPKPRRQRDTSHRPYRVSYDLAYDGGGTEWVGFYRTYLGARIAMAWHRHLASWGGTATLFSVIIEEADRG